MPKLGSGISDSHRSAGAARADEVPQNLARRTRSQRRRLTMEVHSRSSSVRQTVAGAHRFVGLLTGFALRDVTRVGETVRVSSRAGGTPVVAQSKQSSHLATRV